jgi:hypothetical protein
MDLADCYQPNAKNATKTKETPMSSPPNDEPGAGEQTEQISKVAQRQFHSLDLLQAPFGCALWLTEAGASSFPSTFRRKNRRH